MRSEYIEQRHRGYYVAGARISLDSVVYSFNEGQRRFAPAGVRHHPGIPIGSIPESCSTWLEYPAIPLEQANPPLWAKIQRAKAEAAQGQRRS